MRVLVTGGAGYIGSHLPRGRCSQVAAQRRLPAKPSENFKLTRLWRNNRSITTDGRLSVVGCQFYIERRRGD